MKKRILSMIFAILLIFNAMPLSAFAEDINSAIFGGGSGTSSSPYLIKTQKQLEDFRDSVNNGTTYEGVYIKLYSNITFSQDEYGEGKKSWVPIGNENNRFKGTFLGNNRKINNLYIGNFENGCRDIGFFGYVGDTGTVKQINVSGKIVLKIEDSKSYNLAAVVGFNTGLVENCSSSAEISIDVAADTTQCYVGGIVGSGNTNSYVNGCYNSGSINLKNSCESDLLYCDTGGIVGDNYGRTENCYNTGVISSESYHVGGIVGVTYNVAIKKCFNVGKISGKNIVGGIAGCLQNSGSADYGAELCYNNGEIISIYKAGGICGHSAVNVLNCYNTAAVTAQEYVGGIAGYCLKEVKNCYNTGYVTGTENVGTVSGESAISNANSTSYYLNSLEFAGNNAYGSKSVTEAELATASTFESWDFTDVWEYGTYLTERPTLKNNPEQNGTATRPVYAYNETQLKNVILSAAAVRLMANIELTSALTVNNALNLDLNGYVLSLKDGVKQSVIVLNSGYFQLNDSNLGNQTHKFTVLGNGLWKLDEQNGTETVKGGVITGGYGSELTAGSGWYYGGGILVNSSNGTVINNGNIVGCTSNSTGGGVYIRAGKTFTFSGGSIMGCYAEGSGGGIGCEGRCTFTMSGNALISNCKAKIIADGLLISGSMYANGGKVDNTVRFESATVQCPESNSVTTHFMQQIENNASTVKAGIYYVGMPTDTQPSLTSGPISGKKITFMVDGQQYACGVVASFNKTKSPVAPNCVGRAFTGWYTSETEQTESTKYTFGGTTSKDITLYAGLKPYTYQITLDTDNATSCDELTQYEYGTEVTLPTPTKTGFTFTGWSGTGLDGENNTTVVIPIGSTGNRSYKAHYSVNYYTVNFDTRNGSTVDNKTNVKWTDKVLDGIESTEKGGYEFICWKYDDTTVTADTTYAELVANESVDSITLKAEWKDVTNPVISGVEKGKIYCSAQTVTVSDNDGVKTVTVNGRPITLDTDGKFILSYADGEQKIVVTDNAGNKTEMTVTVNDGHTYNWQTENGKYWQKCTICNHETDKKDIPIITINGADKVCVNKDYTFSFTLPEGVTNPKATYYPEENDYPLTANENNGVYTATVSHSEYRANSTVYDFYVHVYATTADGFEFCVRKEVLFQRDHTGGTATCIKKAECEVCGDEYGEVDADNHEMLKHIAKEEASVTETGNTEYWYCEACKKYFADEACKTEIKAEETLLEKLPPEIIEGEGQSVTVGDKTTLTFRSNAAYSDFIMVGIDGKEVNENNYTKKEGSTIITLNAEYVSKLAVGEHTLGIVSQSGTATTTFTVNAAKQVDNNNQTTSPKTGDNGCITLWIALLFVSGGMITITECFKKRKAFDK